MPSSAAVGCSRSRRLEQRHREPEHPDGCELLGGRVEVENGAVRGTEVAAEHDEDDSERGRPPASSMREPLGPEDGDEHRADERGERQHPSEHHEGTRPDGLRQLPGPRVGEPVIANGSVGEEDRVARPEARDGGRQRFEEEHVLVVARHGADPVEWVLQDVHRDGRHPEGAAGNERENRGSEWGSAGVRWSCAALQGPPSQEDGEGDHDGEEGGCGPRQPVRDDLAEDGPADRRGTGAECQTHASPLDRADIS